MGSGIVATLALIYAGFTALAVAAAVSIVRKAGYSGWWVCAGAVPLVNVVMLFAFAFADWPVLHDLRRAQSAPAGPRHSGLSGPPALTSEHPAFSYATVAPQPTQPKQPTQPSQPTEPMPPREPAYAAPTTRPPAEPIDAQPAYAVPTQPSPSAPRPPFPGYRDSNILPGG